MAYKEISEKGKIKIENFFYKAKSEIHTTKIFFLFKYAQHTKHKLWFI